MPPEVTHGFSTTTGSTTPSKSGQHGPADQLEPTAATPRQEQSTPKNIMAMFTIGLPPTGRGKSSKICCSSTTKNRQVVSDPKDSKQSTEATTTSTQLLTSLELFQRLDSDCHTVVLVDCRSFLAFNKKHIRGAVNANCTNSLTRRRLQQGKLSLNDLATSDESREVLYSRFDKDVVVYDEDSHSLDNMSSNHPTLLVLNLLRNEGARTSLLKGGLSDFQNQFERMCQSDSENANISPDTPICASPVVTVPESDYTTARQKEIDVPATQLLTFLYVGNEKDAADIEFLQQARIGNVLNVTQSVPCFHQDSTNINYKRISVRDNSLANLKKHFDDAFLFIEAARKRHERVLLHCSAGISRSSTIAIAYIMKYRGMSMCKAYNLVKSRRSIIAPNLNFVGQLATYEKTMPHQLSAIPSYCAISQVKRRTASPHPIPPTLETAL